MSISKVPPSPPRNLKDEYDYDDVIPEDRSICLSGVGRRSCSATTYADPIFETDYEESDEMSDYSPARRPLKKLHQKAIYPSQLPSTGKDMKTPRSKGAGEKKSVLVRIDDDIRAVEVQFQARSSHIHNIDGKRPVDVLYGFLNHDFGPDTESKRIALLKSDKDIELHEKNSNVGYCQGCGSLRQVPLIYRWIEHKVSCKQLRQKLSDELKQREGQARVVNQKAAADTKESDGDGVDETSRETEVKLNPIGPKKSMIFSFHQNELVSVRVGNKIQEFRYTSSHGRVRLDQKTLSQVFYGIEMPKSRPHLWQLFHNDPDMKSFSPSDSTCVCNGCGSTIAMKDAVTWLNHRLRCHVLQKHLLLQKSADNHWSDDTENENARIADAPFTTLPDASSTTRTLPTLSEGRPVLKRKRKVSVTSLADDHKYSASNPTSCSRKTRKQTFFKPEGRRGAEVSSGDEGVLLIPPKIGATRSRATARSKFSEAPNELRAEKPEGLLISLLETGTKVLEKIGQFLDAFE